MPKQNERESVLHDWVHDLPFQMQALLLTAMRGPDAAPKHNSAKSLVRYLRGVVLKPAGNWSGLNDNDFMWGDYEGVPVTENKSLSIIHGNQMPRKDGFRQHTDAFLLDHDAFPHHFIMHLVHCAEVVGYKHPKTRIRHSWNWFYTEMCKAFHMGVETESELDKRLNDFGEGFHNKTNQS